MPDYIELGISENEISDFLANRIWKAIEHEMVERDSVLMQVLRTGSNKDTDTKLGNDDTVRGRLAELDYCRSIPSAILADIRMAKAKDKENKESEE